MNERLFSLSIISLLGTFSNLPEKDVRKVTLKDLMLAVIDPKNRVTSLSSETICLGLKTTLDVLYSIISRNTSSDQSEPQSISSYFSSLDKRERKFDINLPNLFTAALHELLTTAIDLNSKYQEFVSYYASRLTHDLAPNPTDEEFSKLDRDMRRLISLRDQVAGAILSLSFAEKNPHYVYKDTLKYVQEINSRYLKSFGQTKFDLVLALDEIKHRQKNLETLTRLRFL